MKQNAKNDIVYDVLNRTILQKELDDDEEEKNKQLVHANTYTARDRTQECISLSIFQILELKHERRRTTTTTRTHKNMSFVFGLVSSIRPHDTHIKNKTNEESEREKNICMYIYMHVLCTDKKK